MPSADMRCGPAPCAWQTELLTRQHVSVKLDCVVGEAGVLHGCRVVTESPESKGVGAYALYLVPYFRLNMAASCAKTGDDIVIPIQFAST